MIIWSGLGFLVVVFAFGAALLCNWAFDAALGAGYYSAHDWTIGVALFIGAALSWGVGRFLLNRKDKIVIDKATGKEIVLRSAVHRLFFIPMHNWGFILGVIGVVLCVKEFFK